MLVTLFFKIVLILFGTAACWAAFWSQYMNRQAKRWPAVEGVIIASTLEPSSDGENSVRIVYQYTVNGHSFTSSQFSYTGLSNAPPAQKRRIAQYPRGRRVPVFYDPQKPSRAVLERGESFAWIYLGLIGVLFVYAGLVIS